MRYLIAILICLFSSMVFAADSARVWNCSDRKDGTTICNVDLIGTDRKVLLTERMTVAKGTDLQKESDKVLAAFSVRQVTAQVSASTDKVSQSDSETIYTKSQVSQILIDKGYLTKGQTLDDLPKVEGIK